MPKLNKTFWRRSEQFPPILIRLLARRPHGPPLSTADISQASGLTIHQVESISHSTDWSCCTVVDMRRFLVACSCDWEDTKHLDRMMDYIRKGPTWKFLRVHPDWSYYFKPLLERYIVSITKGK